MPNPWEKYQDTSTAQGPWAKYSAPPPAPPQANPARDSAVAKIEAYNAAEKQVPWYKRLSGFGTPLPTFTPEEKATFNGHEAAVFGGNPGVNELEGLSGYVETGPIQAAKGAGKMLDGDFAKGGHEAMSGLSTTLAPLLPFVGAGAPASTARALGGAAVASSLAQPIAKAAGANEDQAALTGDIAGLLGGSAAASGLPRALLETPIKDLLTKHAIDLADLLEPRKLLIKKLRAIGEGATAKDTVPAVGDFPKTEVPSAPQVPQNAGQVPAIGNFPKTDIPEAPASPRAELMPSERAPSGESALRMVLTGQDNANLMRIAKSRGINVTREAQLKPGVADKMLIDKIMGDFSPEELDNISAQYMEANRFKHEFGDIGPEAWKALSMKTYFPDVKLPMTMLKRTTGAIQQAGEAQAAAGEAAPQYAYRVRDVGDKGIMPKGHAQATLDPEQAQGYISGRGQAQNSAQEVVRVDLNKLSPKDYILKKGPGGKTWVQFKNPVPESFIEGATPEVPHGNEAELLQKSIDLLNRLHQR